ncbi:MAG: HEPN domain-containing protein [Methanophagales archaeon ANME-1-THS]|nr:MAG: HEPN domain-containing protein [Methanophagales archaeon ANME-1-THS]
MWYSCPCWESMDSEKMIEEIKKGLLKKYGEKLVSVLIFGSYSRGEEYNDVDLLIVLKEKKSKAEKIKDAVELKTSLKLPLDLVILSREECLENFRSHHPFYFEIALDGEILFDEGFLKEILEDTRAYIKRRGLERRKSAWLFPSVSAKIEFSITNEELAESWLEDAKRDLISARILYEAKIFDKAVYHCQQCVEKVAKAVLICFGKFKKSHYVSDMLKEEVGTRDLTELDELVELAAEMEVHISTTRYPLIDAGRIKLPSEEYDERDAGDAIKKTENVLKKGENL